MKGEIKKKRRRKEVENKENRRKGKRQKRTKRKRKGKGARENKGRKERKRIGKQTEKGRQKRKFETFENILTSNLENISRKISLIFSRIILLLGFSRVLYLK